MLCFVYLNTLCDADRYLAVRIGYRPSRGHVHCGSRWYEGKAAWRQRLGQLLSPVSILGRGEPWGELPFTQQL